MSKEIPTWRRRRSSGPLLIAHRGASARAPENSLEAFHRAVADGADGVELDARCCATGEVVVFHDDDLTRLAGRRERIDELSWRVLREVRLGGGVGIPSLAEAFEACGPDLLVNVELKVSRRKRAETARLVEGVVQVIARTFGGRAPRVLVSSFSLAVVKRWRRRCPQVQAAWIFHRNPRADLAALAGGLYAVHPQHRLCRADRVASWRDLGLAVHAWTIDDPASLRALAALGVDGLVTNDPAAARAALLT